MEVIPIIEKIFSIITLATTGGIVGWFIKAKYIGKHEAAQLDEEVKNNESLEIRNAEAVIKLYKTALDDVASQCEKLKDQYETQIRILNENIRKLESESKEYAEQIKSQSTTIDTLTRNQIKLKLDLMAIKSQSLSDCDTCEFKSSCEKFKAKQLIDE